MSEIPSQETTQRSIQRQAEALQAGLKKVALRRRAGYPIGQPAPCYLLCPCGTEIDVPEGASVVRCPTCGLSFSSRGWIL